MIENLFGVLDTNLAIEFSVKICLSLLLGGIVGLERERRHMPAGLRTFMLVSVGSCIFTLISYHGFTGGDPAANDFRFLILLRGHGFDLGRKAARFCQSQLRLHAITSLIHTH